MKRINLVTSVERILSNDIPFLSQVGKTVRITDPLPWIPVEIKPHASLTISRKKEENVWIWEAKLMFKTCEDIDVNGRWVYKCGLIDGSFLLVGSKERPYAMASVVDSMPENVTENQLVEVTVSWLRTRPVPRITV